MSLTGRLGTDTEEKHICSRERKPGQLWRFRSRQDGGSHLPPRGSGAVDVGLGAPRFLPPRRAQTLLSPSCPLVLSSSLLLHPEPQLSEPLFNNCKCNHGQAVATHGPLTSHVKVPVIPRMSQKKNELYLRNT